jgi:glutamate:GABA antiporter
MTVIARDGEEKLVAEVVPDQVLPKVLSTFDLVAVYVFIIFFVSGSSIMAGGGWASMSMWIAGLVLFLIPAAMAVLELGGLWPSQGGVYVWAYRTMNERWAFLGGFLSWIPVILAGTLNPAAILSYLGLAFNWTPSLTVNIILQLVILWLCVAFAMRKLKLTKMLANGVFVFYMILVFAVFAAGLAYALGTGNGHPAVAFHASDAFSFNFGTYGWIFGVALLYLVGVETPFNMGAEFVTPRSSKKMILWGSIALSIGYIIATIGVLLDTPGDKNDPVTGVARVFGFAGAGWLQGIAAVGIAVVIFIAFSVYQSAYSRLVFVSGLERHLPRLFTHLNARTRNPVTALLIQGVISSIAVVVLYSQQSLTTIFLCLQGALTVLWLASGYFFLIPVIIARYKYADRYASEAFWRIPGGKAGAIIVSVIGIGGTTAGIYYTFTLPFSADIAVSTWESTLGAICGVVLVAGALVYVFGRRSGQRLSDDQRLAHLAVLTDDELKTAKPTPTQPSEA